MLAGHLLAIAEISTSHPPAHSSEHLACSGRGRFLTTREDAVGSLTHLSQAVSVQKPILFESYAGWLKIRILRQGGTVADVQNHFSRLCDTIRDMLGEVPAQLELAYLRETITQLPFLAEDLPSFVDEEPAISLLAHQFLDFLLLGERHLATDLILDAVKTGIPVKEIYLKVFQTSQVEVGRLWQTNQISVAKEHYCTAATQFIMSLLYPQIFATEKHGRSLVATCVAGNLHELGVRMVTDFFEMEGWHTYFLGANTPHESVIATVKERKASVLAISATLNTHIEPVRSLVQLARSCRDCQNLKILVGGAPFNLAPDLWKSVGADGTASNAQQAIELAEQLSPPP